MKFFLITWIVISSSFAQIDSRVEVLLDQLTAIHGTDWGAIAKAYEGEESKLRATLKNIYENPSYFYPNEGNTSSIKSNAIWGYGHFVTKNSLGGLSSADNDFYREILRNEFEAEGRGHFRASIYASLKNTGTFEAEKILLESLESEEELYLKQQILENAIDVLAGPIKHPVVGDLVYNRPFYPNLRKAPQEREEADWENFGRVLKNKIGETFKLLPKKYRESKVVIKQYADYEKRYKRFTLGKSGRTPSSLDEEKEANDDKSIGRKDLHSAGKPNVVKGKVVEEPGLEKELPSWVLWILFLSVLALIIYFIRKKN